MKNIAVQLYSARNTPLEEALPVIAQAGYTQVEGYGENVRDPDALHKLLEKYQLHMVSLHVGFEELRTDMKQTLSLARDFGINHLVCPYLAPSQRPATKEGWSEIAKELADINAQISSVGRDFAWHNHDFEFIRLADGSLPMRTLLDEVPDMFWEIDVGWIARVGQNPGSWIRTYPDRISAVHLKDVAVEGQCMEEDGWADVGRGTIEWQQVTDALAITECEIFAVEHDNPADLQRFVSRCYDTVSAWDI